MCHYGNTEPYKTVEVKADNKLKAMKEGTKILKPSTIEHICFVKVRPNEEYDLHYEKKPKLK